MAVCYICDSRLYGERTRVSSSITPHSNVPYADKICELMGEDFVVIVTPADLMCKRCTSLLIHIDKLEIDLKLVKNALTSYVQKKYGLLPAGQPVKSIEVVNGNLRTDDLEVGQRKVPSGLTVRGGGEPSTSAGGSNASSSRTRQESSKIKIYKCGFCSFQSKDLGHVRFHMRTHMKKKENERSNQTVTKTVTQQQPQQQHQNQPPQAMGVQNKQQQMQQQPFRQQQPQQQKKRLYRCQVCSASFDTRLDCLEHIHKDHNQPQTSTAEERETEVTTLDETASVLPQDQQVVVKNEDENHLIEDKGTMNTDTDLDMLLNENIPNVSAEVPVQEAQNIPENMSDQAGLLQVNQEIPVTNVDMGDMAIGGGETGTDNLDIESMLAAIHNDGGNPQNLL